MMKISCTRLKQILKDCKKVNHYNHGYLQSWTFTLYFVTIDQRLNIFRYRYNRDRYNWVWQSKKNIDCKDKLCESRVLKISRLIVVASWVFRSTKLWEISRIIGANFVTSL
jgi:hypothetical protein